MYVRATDKFIELNIYPVELGFIPNAGYVFEVTEERYKRLNGDNRFNVTFVEKIKTPTKTVKKAGKAQNKLGIIIPNYNNEIWLERCLNSVLDQTYKNYEIVFVDDMSTDGSVTIARKLLKKPNKIVQLKQKRYNGGARNEAYLHLSKDVDYVYYVDSDDWLCDTTALERINEYLKNAPDVLFVGLIEHLHDNDRVCFTPDYKDKYQAMQGWSGSCGKVIRRELATMQSCLYSEGTLKEDRNQHYRICIRMRDFLCMAEPVYVWNRDNMQSTTRVREKVHWGTSTIRHWADTLELYLSERGKDAIIDSILSQRVEMTRNEAINGGDRQY